MPPNVNHSNDATPRLNVMGSAEAMHSQSLLENAISLVTAEECIITMAKVLDNILTESEYQKKTRKLKLTNETFHRRVSRHRGAIDFLLACRFTRKGETLQLRRENESKLWLWQARYALHDRAKYLGFAIPDMPPKPASDGLFEGRENSDTMSLYETSTIGTMEELECEIQRELEEDAPPSKSPKTYNFAISPLPSPRESPSVSRLDYVSSDPSLSAPVLPESKSTESKPIQESQPVPPVSASATSEADMPDQDSRAFSRTYIENDLILEALSPLADSPFGSGAETKIEHCSSESEAHHQISPHKHQMPNEADNAGGWDDLDEDDLLSEMETELDQHESSKITDEQSSEDVCIITRCTDDFVGLSSGLEAPSISEANGSTHLADKSNHGMKSNHVTAIDSRKTEPRNDVEIQQVNETRFDAHSLAEECIITMAKVLDNILTESEYQKKTRKLKLTNETFHRRVSRHRGAIDFLLACRFTRKGETLQLRRENESKLWLWQARYALHDRAKYLGFAIPDMPPKPASDGLFEGRENSDTMSLYETSTIGTMEELECEIQRELEEDAPPSKSPKTYNFAISPLPSPRESPSVSRLDYVSSDPSLSAPVLPESKSTESKPIQESQPVPPVSVSATSEADMPDQDSRAFSRTYIENDLMLEALSPLADSPFGSGAETKIEHCSSESEAHHQISPHKHQMPNEADNAGGWDDLDEDDLLSEMETELDQHESSKITDEQSSEDVCIITRCTDDFVGLSSGLEAPSISEANGSTHLADKSNHGMKSNHVTAIDSRKTEPRNDVEIQQVNETRHDVDSIDLEGHPVLTKDMVTSPVSKSVQPTPASALIGKSKSSKQDNISNNSSTPPRTDFERGMLALLQEKPSETDEKPSETNLNSRHAKEMVDVFGSSRYSLNISEVIESPLSPKVRDSSVSMDTADQIVVNVRPPPISKSQDGLKDFFNGTESESFAPNDSDEELMHLSHSPSGDDLEKEMASLLAQSSDTPISGHSSLPRSKNRVGVRELDDSLHSRNAVDDHSIAQISIVDRIQDARLQNLAKSGSTEEMDYSSTHAHSDWKKLHALMTDNSLASEYEVCCGSLCTLSVVCADLPTTEFGIRPVSHSSKRKNRSKRSWLPLELIMGLWNLVLSSDESVDTTRNAYVCSKLYEVLLSSRYLEVLQKGENGASLPHSIWVRVRKEKIVLLGFALPTSISHQYEWMRKLAQAIVDDTQFWYGRYALPTIALAGGDDESKAKSLLRDMDFVQSRIDVIGIVTGTHRHILDCKMYVEAKRQRVKDRQFKCDDVKFEGGEAEIGVDVALDGCQQVATYLYRQGQVLSKSKASTVMMLELATALHLIGMAVGEFGDWEMETQIYQKTIKVLNENGAYATECAADTLLSMGHCSLGQGDFGAAMSCYEEARDIYRSELGEKSNKVAKALHHMGVIQCERGEYETAMESFKISLKIKQGNGMKDEYDEQTADTLCWIGKVYREQGSPDKAKKYFDAARDVKEEFCGADSLEVAEILQNIAVLYDDGGDFERSLRYYRKSLKIRRAALGDQHEDVCDLISCIGSVYKSMGEEQTALKVFRRANELRAAASKTSNLTKQQTQSLILSYEDVLDILRLQYKTSETPEMEQDEIACILLKMGHLYDTMGNYDKSDRCYEKALKLRLSTGDKVKAGQVLNVKGISYAKRRLYAEAMSAFDRALALRKESLGEGHLDVGETLHNMGNCAAKSGDFNEARTYYDESLRIKRKQLGSKNTSVAQTLHNIGNVLAAQGSNEGAMKNYKEALNLRKEVLGKEHVEVAYSLHCIAKINRKQHDVDAARENFNSALRIKRLQLKKNHPSIAETLEQLGSLYMEIGEEDEAALCLNGALNIYKAKHGEGVKVAEVYEQLGTKYERKETTTGKAIAHFNKSLRVRLRIFGEYHETVADLHYRIGKLQRNQGSSLDALASFQAATRIRKKTNGRDDIVISDVLTDAGKLQMKLGQIDIADRCFAEALRIRSLILDPRHEKIGQCLLLNGEVLIKGEKFQEAIDTFKEALSIFQDNAGEYGGLCANAYQHLGFVYKTTKDYDKSLEFYGKCLKARKGDEVGDNLEVADINYGLGEVYFAKGDYRRAEEYFRDSVEVMATHLGEDHPDVADAVIALGRTCTKLSSPDEAIMYFEQAKITKQAHLGDTHLEVAEISLEIGRAHAVKREHDEALQSFNSYLRVRRTAVGDDITVCDILHEIGTAEYDIQQYDAALKSFASALTLYRVLLGDDNIKVASTLYSLGLVYEAKRGYRESMKYHKDSFRLRRRLLGPDDVAVAQSLDRISFLYMKQPNLEKALQSMKEVLRIQTQQLGKEHTDVGTSLYGMGVIFSEMNELEKAMECYTVSLRIRSDHFGEASVEVAQTLHNMGTVLGKNQDFAAALDHWRQALVAYREAGLTDEEHLVAVTIGNINMAEAYLNDVTKKGIL